MLMKWNTQPVYAPDDDLAGGVPLDAQDTQVTEGEDAGEGEQPAPKPTVRQQLESSVKDITAKTDKAAAAAAKGKKKAPVSRARQAAAEEAEEGAEVEEAVEGEEQAGADQAQQLAPPDGFSKEAKVEWTKTPPTVQAAILKREKDMAAGVNDLKTRYSEFDKAIAPYMDSIRQMNATPGEAVNRLFLWMGAIAKNPQVAFPALAA